MKRKIYFFIPLILLVVVALLPSLITYLTLRLAQYNGGMYAVSLENGETLYGDLESVDAHWVKLSNIYYFQSVTVGEETTKSLVAQGSNPISSPDNFMLVNRNKIVLLERVGKDAKILQIISSSNR